MATLFASDASYDSIIEAEARAQGVPVAMIKAFIASESKWNPAAFRYEPARSGRAADGSRGLMQLLLSTARGLGYTGPVGNDVTHKGGLYDAATNIHWGTKYLRDVLRQSSGKIPEAISIYNGGLRPSLGFGRRAEKTVTVCLARDKKNNCINKRTVPVGQFGNQPYVDRVLGYYTQYLNAQDDGSMGAVTVVTTPVEAAATAITPQVPAVTFFGVPQQTLLLAAAGVALGLFVVSRKG